MNRFFSGIADYIRESDKAVFGLSSAATLFGSLAVLSAGSVRQFLVQFFGFLLGLTIAIVISKIDYSVYKKLWPLVAIAGLVPVFLTFFIGFAPNGTDDKAWLMLPGNITFQPSELLKIAFIITFSLHLSTVKEKINKFYNIILLCIHGGIPVVLIHLQGDDGTAMVFFIMFVCMMFSAGIKIRYFIAALIGIIVSLPILYFYILSDEQRERVLSLFDLEADLLGTGWQQWQGRIALANGGFFGKGLFNGDIVQSDTIPEAYNDFIFTAIGEELGLVGCLLVFVLLGALCFRAIVVGHNARDNFGSYMCMGVFAMLLAQIIINIGMCTSLLPVIGVTLPFFSAGGTSLCCLYCGVGLLLSVHLHKTSRTLYLHDNF